MIDWKEAENYLALCERTYTAIGSAGYIALTYVVRPLRDRLNSGERTQTLYDEIMAIAL
jgi:hypothetical protein